MCIRDSDHIVTVENIDTNGERLEGISGDQCQCHCIFVPGVDKYEKDVYKRQELLIRPITESVTVISQVFPCQSLKTNICIHIQQLSLIHI